MVIIKRFLVYSMLIGLALYSGFLLQQSNQFKSNVIKQDNHADTFLENVKVTKMNRDGSLNSQLTANRIIHYPYQDTAIFTNPHVIIYSKNGESPWHTTAKMGKSQHGKEIIYLSQNVVIHQAASASNKDVTMTTSFLAIYPKKEYVETDRAVKYIEPGTVITSKGMRAYLENKRIQLLSNTRGEHEKMPS